MASSKIALCKPCGIRHERPIGRLCTRNRTPANIQTGEWQAVMGRLNQLEKEKAESDRKLAEALKKLEEETAKKSSQEDPNGEDISSTDEADEESEPSSGSESSSDESSGQEVDSSSSSSDGDTTTDEETGASSGSEWELDSNDSAGILFTDEEDEPSSRKRKRKSSSKRTDRKWQVKRAARELVRKQKKRCKKSGVVRQHKDTEVGCYFKWPNQFVNRSGGHQPTWEEVEEPELMLGIYRMCKKLFSRKKKMAGQVVAQLHELSLADLRDFGFSAIKNSIQSVLQALEQRSLEWKDKDGILSLRERVLLRELRAEVLKSVPRPSGQRGGRDDGDKGPFILCNKFNRDECNLTCRFHVTAGVTFHHVCSYCYRVHKYKNYHSETQCNKKAKKLAQDKTNDPKGSQ